VAFEISGGVVNDCTAAPELIAQLPSAEVIVADKGYDSERIREQIEAQGARVTQSKAMAMAIWMKAFIATDTWSKMPLRG